MVRFIQSADFPEIESWFKARGINMGPWDSYPSTGFIEPGVFAGFMYLTNSKIAFIEGFISNPVAPLRARYKAASEIADKLIALIYTRPYKYISMTSSIRSIHRMGIRKGFKFAETTSRYVHIADAKQEL